MCVNSLLEIFASFGAHNLFLWCLSSGPWVPWCSSMSFIYFSPEATSHLETSCDVSTPSWARQKLLPWEISQMPEFWTYALILSFSQGRDQSCIDLCVLYHRLSEAEALFLLILRHLETDSATWAAPRTNSEHWAYRPVFSFPPQGKPTADSFLQIIWGCGGRGYYKRVSWIFLLDSLWLVSCSVRCGSLLTGFWISHKIWSLCCCWINLSMGGRRVSGFLFHHLTALLILVSLTSF